MTVVFEKLAGDKNEIVLPNGIRFSTPGETKTNNILFTSQWDNYTPNRNNTLVW